MWPEKSFGAWRNNARSCLSLVSERAESASICRVLDAIIAAAGLPTQRDRTLATAAGFLANPQPLPEWKPILRRGLADGGASRGCSRFQRTCRAVSCSSRVLSTSARRFKIAALVAIVSHCLINARTTNIGTFVARDDRRTLAAIKTPCSVNPTAICAPLRAQNLISQFAISSAPVRL